jgi:hypothetical protein
MPSLGGANNTIEGFPHSGQMGFRRFSSLMIVYFIEVERNMTTNIDDFTPETNLIHPLLNYIQGCTVCGMALFSNQHVLIEWTPPSDEHPDGVLRAVHHACSLKG